MSDYGKLFIAKHSLKLLVHVCPPRLFPSSDDEGWYDVVSTERAILTRLSEELFDDVVEDTVLALMFESR